MENNKSKIKVISYRNLNKQWAVHASYLDSGCSLNWVVYCKTRAKARLWKKTILENFNESGSFAVMLDDSFSLGEYLFERKEI